MQETLYPDGDGEHCFVLNDGAHAVVLDGERGQHVNALKYINHSCEPNAIMSEVFVDGCWHVIVVALCDIEPGTELTHDYALTTSEDDALQLVPPPPPTPRALACWRARLSTL